MHRLEPMSHISVTLTVQYLNVHKRKLGTIIIQIVLKVSISSISYGMIVRTQTHCPWFYKHNRIQTHCPWEDLFKHNPNYFQITQPGGSTFPSCLAPLQIFTVNIQFCSPLFIDGYSISLLFSVWSSVSLYILVLHMKVITSYSFLGALLYIFCLVLFLLNGFSVIINIFL